MLDYTAIGQGPEKVLVFHGWFGDYSVWEPTFKAMDSERFTYLFIDYRGYGQSRGLLGEYSMREIAADANELLFHLGIKQVHLIGHSMGGMAMQRFILDRDESIDILSACGVTPVPASGGQLDENAWELFSGAIEDDEKRYAILDFTTGHRLSAAWLHHMVKVSRNTTQEKAYAGYLNAWAKENFADEVSQIRVPMMVCVGEHDGAINAAAMQATYLSWFPDCELQVIPNAGHYPMQETPIDLITRIEKFMASV